MIIGKVLKKLIQILMKSIPSFCLIHSKEINHEKNSSLNKRVLNSLEKVKFIIANSRFTKKIGLKYWFARKKNSYYSPWS